MAMSKIRIRCLVVFSLLEVLLFGELIFGWSSLVFVLKAEGLFGDLCTHLVNTSLIDSSTAENATYHNVGDAMENCFEQDERFNLIFSIGSAFLYITLILSGQMYYRLGTKLTRISIMFLFLLGVLFLAFASPELPWLILPGIMFVGVSGLSMMLSSVEVAILLPKWSPIYVGIACGFFDSSVLTQRIVKELFESGVKRSYSFSSIGILMIVISGLTTYFFPSNAERRINESEINDKKSEHSQLKKYIYKPDSKQQNQADMIGNHTQNTGTHSDSASCTQMQNASRMLLDKIDSLNIVEDNITLMEVICTRKYILQVLWFNIMLLRLLYFVGSINSVLEQTLHSKDKVSYFTDVMAYIMIGGCLVSYFSGQLVQWQNSCCSASLKQIFPLSLTSGLAILVSGMTFVTSDSALYGTFIIFTFFRSFLFSVNLNFLISSFPKKLASVLYGVQCTLAGLISLLQYALFVWTEEYHGAVNGVLLGLCVLSLLQPLFLFIDAMNIYPQRY